MVYTINFWYLALLSLVLLLLMLRHHATRYCYLISARNIFLGGFIFFQLMSVMYWIDDPFTYAQWVILSGSKILPWYSVAVTVSIVCFLFAYHRGWIVSRIAKRIPVSKVEVSDQFLLILAPLFVTVGMILWLTASIPLVGIVLRYVGAASMAVGCGMAAWVWVRKPWNPLLGVYVVGMLIASMIPLMTAFGRRGLVSLALAVVWSMFYRRWHSFSSSFLLTRFAALMVIPVILLGLYTNVRGSRPQNISEVISALQRADLQAGLVKMATPQDSGPASLWIMENFPHRCEYRYLHTLKFMVVYYVPRSLWPDKPDSLGQRLPRMAGMVRVGGLNVGPGWVGQAMAEGGWPVLVLYSLVFGLLIRLIDEIVSRQCHQVFWVMPLGCALGEILALPRGEVSFFASTAIIAIIGNLLILRFLTYILKRTMRPVYRRQYPQSMGQLHRQ